MYCGLRVSAIIAAAGKSRRMGGEINKQFMMMGGMPVLAHTLKAFESDEFIDNIIIVMSEDDIEYCRDNVIKRYGLSKIKDIIRGGAERQQSILCGLEALKGTCDITVTHDGARPFITYGLIDQSIELANKFGAAVCAVPVKDTIKISKGGEFIEESPDRSVLYAVQTPQTFRFDLLYSAHLKAREEGFLGTDDTVLVERVGKRAKLFLGSYDNIKITTPEDIYIGEAILNNKKDRV